MDSNVNQALMADQAAAPRLSSPQLWAVRRSPSSKLSPYSTLTGSYADTQFYRLRQPLVGHAETEPADWLADVAALKTWLASVNGTDGFKVGPHRPELKAID